MTTVGLRTVKGTLDSLEDLDQVFHALYTEKDGKFYLTGVEDLEKLSRALANEKAARKATKERFAPFADYVGNDEAIARLEGGANGGAMEGIVAARLKSLLGPLEAKLQAADEERNALSREDDELTAKDKRARIHEAVRDVCIRRNPWSRQHWNLTEQGQVYAANPERAQQMAMSVGSAIGAHKPPN